MAGSWAQIDPRLLGDEDGDEEEEYEDYEPDDIPYDEERSLGYNPQINSCSYDPKLDHDRKAKKQKLQHRFEQIFEKYGKDFEGVGDEIDLETGLIVVDNGHLKNMAHEGDPGFEEAKEFANPAVEDGDQDAIGDSASDADSEDALEDDEEQESESGEAGNDVFSMREETAESATTPFETEESAAENGSNAGKEGPANGLQTGGSRSRGRKRPIEEVDSEDDDKEEIYQEPADIFEQLPYLKASMLDLQSKHKLGQNIHPDELETLGMSIAKQLADFVSAEKRSPSKPKWNNSKDPTWSYPELPKVPQQRQTQKRRARSPSPLPIFTGPSPGQKSLWAPMQHPKPRKPYKRRKRKGDPVEEERPEDGSADVNQEDADAEPVPGEVIEDGKDERRTCTNCACKESLIWRRGPDGDLCNACGMYYYRYGLLRPLEPPSDSEQSDAGDESDAEAPPRQAIDPRLFTNENAADGSNRRGKGLLRNERFSMEDDAMVIKLKEIDRLSWEKIAKQFPGRTAYGVQCRYSKKLHNRPVEARAYLVNQGYESRHDANGVIIFAAAPAQPKGWTDEQDDLLLKLREDDQLEWDVIADSFPGRTSRAMERRFNHLAKKITKRRSNRQKNKPKKRKDAKTRMFQPYSTEEDEEIVKLREAQKLSWAEIAARLPGRNPMALQKRYVRELAYRNQELGDDPLVEGEDGVLRRTRMKHTRFSREEDAQLLHLRNDLGLAWKEIEFKMPGRKWQSIENRYFYITGDYARGSKNKDSEEATSGAEFVEQLERAAEGADGVQSEDELAAQDDEDITVIDPCDGPSATAQARSNENVPSKELPQEQSPNGHGFFSEGNVPFTPEEDTRIRKMKEIEKLSWEAIAAELPGRSVSAISARYYHTLLPRAESVNPWSKELSLAAFAGPKPMEIASRVNLGSSLIASKRTLRWTKEESDLVVGYVNQGLIWEEIGERMPWRSWKAIKHFYSVNFPTKKEARGKLVAPNKKDNLLRRAVGNNVRHSMPPLIDLTGDDSGDESPSKKSQKPESQSHNGRPQLRKLLPRPAPGDENGRLHNKYAPNISAAPPKSAKASNPLPHAHPAKSKEPSVDAYASLLSDYLAGRDSPKRHNNDAAPSTNPLTPSKPQYHAHPPSLNKTNRTISYFTPVSRDPQYPYYLPPPVNKDGPLFTKPSPAVQNSPIDPLLLEDRFSAPVGDWRQPRDVVQPLPSPLKESTAVSSETVDENADMEATEADAEDEDDHHSPMYDQFDLDEQFVMDDDSWELTAATSIKETYEDTVALAESADHDSGVSMQIQDEFEEAVDAEKEFDQDVMVDGADADDEIEDEDLPTVKATDEDLDIEEDIEEEVEDELDTSGSVVDEQDDLECTVDDAEPVHKSPLSTPPPEDAPNHASARSKVTRDSVEEPITSDIEVESEDETSNQEIDRGSPPPHSWEGLLLMAFNAYGTKPINVKDIHKFIEDHFPYYKGNPSSWKDDIQACLDEKPHFVQASRFRPLWVFKSELQQGVSKTQELEPSSDKTEASKRSITTQSLRERKAKPEEPKPAKRGPGRPRKNQNAAPKAQKEAEAQHAQEKEAEPDTTGFDEEDELAPSPDKLAALALRQSTMRSSSVRPAQHASSDINKDPESSPLPTTAPRNKFLNGAHSSMSELSEASNTFLSSSPLVSMKTPATVYSKADTPGTGMSTLFGQKPQHRGVAALRSSFSGVGMTPRSRSSSVALPGSRKRVVYTPVRDVEGEEDELG